MGKSVKTFEKYLVNESSRHVSPTNYAECPATAFLRYAVDAKDAINNCLKYFQCKKDLKRNKNSQDSLRHISAAMLPGLMGHFESYQKALFSGMFELSRFIESFHPEQFMKGLEASQKIQIDLLRLSAYRGQPAPVGQLLADALKGWHDPDRVNQFMKAFNLKVDFYSKTDSEQLRILWQLRHSIVHTGGWITLPDAQKVNGLRTFGDTAIVFQDTFIPEVVRKLHRLIKTANDRLNVEFTKQLPSSLSQENLSLVVKFFAVESKMKVWL
jgi:hypothetical protein